MDKNYSDAHAMSRRAAIAGLGCAFASAALGSSGPARAEEAAQIASDEVAIAFSDSGIKIDGEDISLDEDERVYLAHDVVYYEDRDEYDSGNPYGEGTDAERHSAEDAAATSVVHITQAGTYRLMGSISAGQVWADLGKDAVEDASAKVTLVFDNLDITAMLPLPSCSAGCTSATATGAQIRRAQPWTPPMPARLSSSPTAA